jgi:beta-lactamase regulating signal transducer with metallopeptidase domain
MTHGPGILDALWLQALALVPLVLAVALAARLLPLRPATRHALWLVVLAGFLAAPLVSVSGLGRSARGAADAAVRTWAHMSSTLDRPTEPAGVSRVESDAMVDRGESGAGGGSASAAAPPPIDFCAPPATSPARRTSLLPARLAAPDGRLPAAHPRPNPVQPSKPAVPGRPQVMPAPRGEWTGDLLAAAGAWRTSLVRLGDDLLSIPPLPHALWLAGTVGVLMVSAASALRTRRLVARGAPAGPVVERLVAAEARRAGLQRPPATVMVDARISPMICCASRSVLVLPRAYWAELDDAGRRAVVLHELSHLRRLDHWVCRAQVLVAALYWWHPLVWVARRRLHEEADLCCDAWVTRLLPASRSAYARALLRARAYVSESPLPAPAMSLGAASPGARRFARRLTMVMKHRHGPRTSVLGALLSAGVFAAAALVTPALACPPEKDKDKEKSQPARALEFTLAPAKPVAPAAPDVFVPEAFGIADAYTSFALLNPQSRQPEERLARLEDRLARLEAHLSRLEELLTRQPGAPTARSTGRAAVPAAPRPTEQVIIEAAPPRQALRPVDEVERSGAAWRTYKLPTGRLEGLTALMSRPDVPVWIRPGVGEIEVLGTPEQQRIFAEFVNLIAPDGAGGATAPKPDEKHKPTSRHG